MARYKRVSIIGHFGGTESLLDGQTVKTKILYQELSQNTNWIIHKVDTYYRKNAPWKLFWQLLIALLTTRDVIIITSQNGRRFLFPVLYFFSKVFGTRVYHDVIGARLAKFTEEHPPFKKYLNSFRVNWVETASLKRDLEAVGVTNAVLLPNFKKLKIVSADDCKVHVVEPYRLCTFSRVMREKGIENAVRAIVEINTKRISPLYLLDIFGPVDSKQTAWFEKMQAEFPEYVTYRGEVHYSQSVDTLKEYFALLFPTLYRTEGVPGTIIDAYAAGLPVIASMWESFSDVVDHGITGYGYAFSDNNALIDLLTKIGDNPQMITDLKKNCTKKAEMYLPEQSVGKIIRTITEENEFKNLR